jgi:hypothetical protein
MAGNYFDFGFHQRQALANQLSMMPLRVWLQAQAMRAAQERAKAEENYRQLMLGMSKQRLGEEQRYNKAKEEIARGRLAEEQKRATAEQSWREKQFGEKQREFGLDYDLRKQELALKKAQGGLSKLMQTPVGWVKGLTILTPNGEPWPNPGEPVGSAFAKGAIVLNDTSARAFALMQSTKEGFDNLLAVARPVLPKEPGAGAALGPIARWMRQRIGDPAIQRYFEAQASAISYVRALANAGRINQRELDVILRGINQANSYPALAAGVGQAKLIINYHMAPLIKAGRLELPTESSASGDAPMSALTAPAMPPLPAGFEVVK